MTHTDEDVKTVIAEFEKEYTDFLHNEFGDDPDKFWAGLDEAGRKRVWAQWCYGGKTKAFYDLKDQFRTRFPEFIGDAWLVAGSMVERYVWHHPEFMKTVNAMHAQSQELRKQIFINGESFIAKRTIKISDLTENVDLAYLLDVNPYADPVLYWFDDYLIAESQPAKVKAFVAQVWDIRRPDAFGNYGKQDIHVQKLEKGDPAFAAIVEAYSAAIGGLVEEQKMFENLV